MLIDSSKTYIGVVEINDDPKRLGRCRVRIIDVFDDIPTEDIPWSSPWKDVNGNEFNVPEVGKIVTCVFDSGNIYKPEYIFADHYNINLENKLKALSKNGYKSMKAVIFDNKTQIYSSDDDGLMIDYKFHNINITEDAVDINLKDDFSKLTLGDANADQQILLGTNFLEWFDKFIKQLSGLGGGPYMGNQGSPVQPMPGFINVMNQYFELRDPKFLSDNVYANSNNKINTVSKKSKDRENEAAVGDKWKSTKKVSDVNFTFDDDVPSFKPSIDPNVVAYTENDTKVSERRKSAPVYVDDTVGPSSGVITDFAKKIVEVGLSQEGVKEDPKNSNTGPDVFIYQSSTSLRPPTKPTKYSPPKTGYKWPWCAAFVSYCFLVASGTDGIDTPFKLPRTASVSGFVKWARNNKEYVETFKPPYDKVLPGDVIVFDYGHIGIAISGIENNKIRTIEGNTNMKGSREGDGVYRKHRNLTTVSHVLRIKYDEDRVDLLPKDQIT